MTPVLRTIMKILSYNRYFDAEGNISGGCWWCMTSNEDELDMADQKNEL